MALGREWTADRVHADFTFVSDAVGGLDALLLGADRVEDLAALLIVALRSNLPTVLVSAENEPFDAALCALGFAPLDGEPAEVAVKIARAGGPRPRKLVENFSLANALRAGLAAGGGPAVLVHLAAIAREAGVVGFPQMIRVLAPESPAAITPGSAWLSEHGAAGLLAHLGDALHDTPTVAGRLKEALPPAPQAPTKANTSHLTFIRGRASGTEVVCQTDKDMPEVSGECRVFDSEQAAVRAVGEGSVEPSDLLVVTGCGPRGGPGLLRLDALSDALEKAGLEVPVLTDGLPPQGARGAWASLAAPEAASGGVIGRLRDGDSLRLNLAEGLIRTGVRADEILSREPLVALAPSGFGYAARYARMALPALEGAGFDS